MPTLSTFKFTIIPPPPLSIPRLISSASASIFRKSPAYPHYLSSISSSRKTLIHCKSSEEEANVSKAEDEWMQKLPDKKKALYSHSLPCVEAWLKSLGFYQSRDDRAVWFVEKPDWQAHLSLDVTDLYIRYLKSGAGSLEKDMERRFSYALSREDIENAILGGP
ncbi:hypothetical protein ABFS82_06G025100 [Erythranthe guttata]|uniref:Uncharacterized protein n=1 Tax=Erythranthe guttata TaxID=4155 RepID=A0A022Q902_ERYGU|nr:PREDICTED: uncharacterized protein LOC105971736 [Erythranthe guttata]EYU25182.1 hypothetical protein MIMGU_mgv1a015259mg [Erythranthe guttata]|eukprot:XP_012852060.1 PREDICTED: uncharacterized protein LOC105971736 [Erythranthe guttata]